MKMTLMQLKVELVEFADKLNRKKERERKRGQG